MRKDFDALKTVAEDCLRQIRFDDDAEKVFDSARVRRALRSMMDLIIEALELIGRFYSRPLLGKRKNMCAEPC